MATGGSENAPLTRRATDFWNGLPSTAKWSIAGVAALLLIGSLWIGNRARGGVGAKVSLLAGKEFNEDERNQAIKAFDEEDLAGYEIRGARIMIPALKKTQYLSALAKHDALPGNFYEAFDDYVKEGDWSSSSTEKARRYQVAKSKMLSKMITTFDDIRGAAVLPPTPKQLGMRRSGPAQVSVALWTTSGEPVSPLVVERVKSLVSHAFKDVTPDQVAVTGNGISGMGSTGSGAQCVDTRLAKFRNEFLQNQTAYEECLHAKIAGLLAYIDGVHVVVDVEVNPDRNIKETITTYGKGFLNTRDTSEMTSGSSQAPRPQGEPGVVPNVDAPPQVPNVGASAASTSTESDTTDRTVYNNDRKDTTKERQDFIPTAVAVLIRIPEKNLVVPGAAPAPAPAGAGQDAAAIPVVPTISEQQIIEMVSVIQGVTPESVKVLPYTPTPIPPFVEPPFDWAEWLGENWTRFALGLLAMFALAGAAMIAMRPAIPKEVLDRLPQVEEIEAEEEMQLLPLFTEDETTKRYAQLKEGVTELVMTSPDAATALIRRWVQE